MTADLPPVLLRRKAVVYVRQSSAAQVTGNLESQRLQYQMVELAREHGFRQVEVIDDDLGRSAAGSTERPGFDRRNLSTSVRHLVQVITEPPRGSCRHRRMAG